MKIMAFNGSPRKKWNTAMMLEKALEGAASKGAATQLIQLYDLDYKGCISCFACKKRGGQSIGQCAVKDDLQPIFAEIRESDALLIGSPIYFGDVTGAVRSFTERLLFAHLVYKFPPETLFPKKIPVGLIYTMNAPEEVAKNIGYEQLFATNARSIEMIIGPTRSVMSYDTYQFTDYSKVMADGIDGEKKKKRREDVFPDDLQKAFELGAALIG